MKKTFFICKFLQNHCPMRGVYCMCEYSSGVSWPMQSQCQEVVGFRRWQDAAIVREPSQSFTRGHMFFGLILANQRLMRRDLCEDIGLIGSKAEMSAVWLSAGTPRAAHRGQTANSWQYQFCWLHTISGTFRLPWEETKCTGCWDGFELNHAAAILNCWVPCILEWSLCRIITVHRAQTTSMTI